MYPKINLNDCEQVLTGRYETSFHNDGTDFIDYGRPTWAVNNLRPSVDSFTIECKGIPESDGTYLSFGAGSAGTRQVHIFKTGTSLVAEVGGDRLTVSGVQENYKFYKINLEVTTSTITAFVNGDNIGSAPVGTAQSTENLFIGGRTDGASFNFEGYLMGATFWKGVGDSKELLEHFPLNGTPNGINGTVGTITDGAPSGVFDRKICRDVSGNGLYALEEATPTILPVADSDRVVGTFDDNTTTGKLDYIVPPVNIQAGGNWELSFKFQHRDPTGNAFGGIITSSGPSGIASSRVVYFEKDGTSDDAFFYFHRVDGSNPAIIVPICDGNFHDVRVTVENSRIAKVYLNGSLYDTYTSSIDFKTDATQTFIGSQITTRSIDAYMWDVVYSVDGQEVFNYPINDGAGSTIRDISGNGNDGVLADGTPDNFWSNGISYKANLNPTGSALIPYPNSFETKATLETYEDKAVSVVPIAGATRAIGSDYVGSYIPLTISPFLSGEEWSFECMVGGSPTSNVNFYAEGNTTQTNTVLRFGSGSDSSKLRVFLRAKNTSVFTDFTSSTTLFDGTIKHLKIWRSFSNMYCSIGGVQETISTSLSGAIDSEANTSTIGALIRTSVGSDFEGDFYNFNLNGTKIKLSEGTGTAIYDTQGSQVGTLVDPSGTFWDNGVTFTQSTYISKNTDSIFHNVTKKNSSFDPVAEFFTNKS